MSAAVFPPGSLLAERFRVTSEREGGALRVIDAHDELSAASRRVRLVVVPSDAAPSDVESAVKRVLRYAIGVSGHAELVGVFALGSGLLAFAYSVGEARFLDASVGGPVASSELRGAVERVLRPLHEQGMAHGALAPELVGQAADGSAVVLGFGLAQALGRSAAPARDASALADLFGTPAAEAPEPSREVAPEPAFVHAPPAAPSVAPAPVVPPPPSVGRAPPSSRSPSAARSWIGPLAIGLGALIMVAGVGTTYVLSKRLPPAPGPSAPVAVTAPPPVFVPPLPAPSPPSSAGHPSLVAPSPSAARSMEPPPLTPPLRTAAPAGHAAALIPVDTQPVWGPARAPVTLTLFADLECPHTRALLPNLLRLKTELGDDVRWVFRHRPLSQHAESERVARLLAGVGEELGPGVFWKLVSELARDPDGAPMELVTQWLEGSGVHATRRSELEALPAARARVDADLVLGAELLVRSTPTLYVNGQRFEGFQPLSALAPVVEHERRAGVFALLSGAAPDDVYVLRTTRNLINLGEDPPERACVADRGAPERGLSTAPVTIVHFCAYESAYCQQAEPALAAVLARHPRDLRILWRSFPIEPEGDGRTAANFALAARKAGGDKAFWLVHRALLEARAAVDAPALAKVVKELGLDTDGLLSAARSRSHDASVKADMELGRKLGVSGVPTTFIDGRRTDGLLSAAELEILIREELALARRLEGTHRGTISDLVCSARGAP
jgi:protein-disulfide isomerase